MTKRLDLIGEFIESLVRIRGLDDTLEAIKEHGHPLLKSFGVVKWKTEFITPPDAAYREGASGVLEFIVVEGAKVSEEDAISKTYGAPNGGSLKIEFFRDEAQEWAEDASFELSKIMNFMFIVLGRGRVFSSYDTANITDVQTGVPNQVGLARFIARHHAQKNIHIYTAAFMNIKNFKLINAKYGTKIGDQYLKKFALSMAHMIEDDEIIARVGGDNFVVIFRKANVIEYDEKLRKMSFYLEIQGEQVEFKPKLRGGIYSVEEGDEMHEILEKSAAALQYSRQPDMSDFVWYQEYMSESRRKFSEVQHAFPAAIKNNEFVAFYQPKVSLDDYTLCGAEALCRWKKDDTFVPPMEFIPVLEMDGSVTKLDFYMLEKVCKDVVALKNKGINPGKISVNFSKHHIHDKMLSDRIIKVIDSYGVDHSNIEIELTEMYAYDDYEDVHTFISQMRQAGINTSIDDFGTGYSTLNMIAEFETDVIKMDKSFLDNIESKEGRHRTMVKNVVHLINDVGMESLAEGVETKTQCELLDEWGCKIVQGYLFDKPLPLEEFEKRLLNPKYEK